MFGDNFFIIDNSNNDQQIERRKDFIEVSKKVEAFLQAPLSKKAQEWIQGNQ